MKKSKIIFILAIVFWLLGYLLFISLSSKILVNPEKITDSIIVLTGGKGRIVAGTKLLAQNKANKMLISGVKPQTSLKELKINQINNKLLTDVIFLDHLSTDTKTNAKESAKWIYNNNFTSLRLVTSDYHILRSLLEFKEQMPGIVIIANPISSYTQWHWLIRYRFFLEYNKFLVVLISQNFSYLIKLIKFDL